MNDTGKDLVKAVRMAEKLEREGDRKDPWRLHLHLMPPTGWMNDPNGLCQFQGNYHVFFQYSPFDAKGGMKFWGHYVTKDFVSWKYKGVALAPDENADCHGVFSGSAFVTEEKAYLFYTGNVEELGNFDYVFSGRESNTILVESDDLEQFGSKKVVMDNSCYPKDDTCHVRDPKVFSYDGKYYMVQGARTEEERGEVLLFRANRPDSWVCCNRISTQDVFGYMWECPDLFCLGEQWVLSVNPQGIKPDGLLYQNACQSGYFFLDGDFTTSECRLSAFTEWDRGFDFYAPQTFLDDQGRRILIGWMGVSGSEEFYTNKTLIYGWQHCLTMPREVFLENGKIYTRPVKEMENIRSKKGLFFEAEGKKTVEVSCPSEIWFCPKEPDSDFLLELNQDWQLFYDTKKNILWIEFLNDTGAGRKKRGVSLKKIESVQIYLDASAVEIYLNQGEEVFSTRYYPEEWQGRLDIKGTGEIRYYELNPIEIEW